MIMTASGVQCVCTRGVHFGVHFSVHSGVHSGVQPSVRFGVHFGWSLECSLCGRC